MKFRLSANGVVLPISPSKVNLIASVIRHKSLDEAILTLSFSSKKGGILLKKMLMGFNNSLKKQQQNSSDYFLSRLEVGKSHVLKKTICRAKSVSNRIRRRFSVIYCVVSKKENLE